MLRNPRQLINQLRCGYLNAPRVDARGAASGVYSQSGTCFSNLPKYEWGQGSALYGVPVIPFCGMIAYQETSLGYPQAAACYHSPLLTDDPQDTCVPVRKQIGTQSFGTSLFSLDFSNIFRQSPLYYFRPNNNVRITDPIARPFGPTCNIYF